MVFVVVIPLLSVVVFGIMLITMPLYKKVQSYLDEILLKTRENLIGVRVLRAFNKEEKEKAEFEENNQMLTKEQKFVGSISGLMNPLTYIIVNVGIIVLIYVGAVRVNMGSLTQGEVVALVNYMSQILVELVKLANLIITVTKAAACGKRIEAVLPAADKGPFEAALSCHFASLLMNTNSSSMLMGLRAVPGFTASRRTMASTP